MQHDPSFAHLVAEIKPHIRELSVTDVQQKMTPTANLTLIDVREDHEWAEMRIPGALHCGRGILERDIANLVSNKAQTIILYCGGGFRSALAAFNLQKMGYTNVYSMDGGIKGWQANSLPIEH